MEVSRKTPHLFWVNSGVAKVLICQRSIRCLVCRDVPSNRGNKSEWPPTPNKRGTEQSLVPSHTHSGAITARLLPIRFLALKLCAYKYLPKTLYFDQCSLCSPHCSLVCCYSKCGPRISSTVLNWEHVWKAESQSLPRSGESDSAL